MKKAFIQLHLAVMLWGVTAILGKLITLTAPVLVWYRMLLTAFFCFLIILLRKEKLRVDKKGFRQLAFIGSIMAAHWIAFYASIKVANISIAVICLSTSSVFTSMLEPLINNTRFKKHEIFLGLFAIIGIALIYHFEIKYGYGILLGIIAAILSSLFTVLNKQIAHLYPSRTMVFYQMSTGWLCLTLIAPVYYFLNKDAQLLPQQTNISDWLTTGQKMLESANDWLWLVILSLCCTVWAQSLAITALKKLSSFTVCLSVNLEPVYGIFLAFIFFDENKHLHTGFYWRMLLIVIAVLLQIVYVFGLGKAKYK